MGSIWHREAYHDKFCSVLDPVGESPLDFSIRFIKLSGSALKCIRGLTILALSTANIPLEFPLLLNCYVDMLCHIITLFSKPAKAIPLKVKTDDVPVLKSPWGFPGTRTCGMLLFFFLETFLSLLMSTSKFLSVCWYLNPCWSPAVREWWHTMHCWPASVTWEGQKERGSGMTLSQTIRTIFKEVQ